MANTGPLPVESSNAPKAIGPYSQAIIAGPFLYCSGQVALDPKVQQFISGGVGEETAQVLKNLQAVVEAAGAKWTNVIKTTVYLKDLGDFAKFNEVYAQYFAKPFPARVTVEVAKLPLGAKVEIDAVVWLNDR